MQLPRIAPGKRFVSPLQPGSADALLLARLAEAHKAAEGHATAILTADPADAQRLAEELLFFSPALRVAVFPDWETLPYDTFSPHQDLVSERLATLWRLLQRELDVVLPANDSLTDYADPSPRRDDVQLQQGMRSTARAEGGFHAGRLQPRSRWCRQAIRGARWDRSISDGFDGALPSRPVR
jgi:transcription-repair coupling factor (superfamily II helicase)